MSWIDDYQAKRKTPDEAVRVIQSGQTVYIQPSCSTPQALVRAMVRRAGELENVEVVQLKTLGCADYARPEYEGSFRTNNLFIGENVREAVAEGRGDYVPIFLHEIEGLFERGDVTLDVVMLQVSPPDRHGFMSLGTGVDCTLTAAERGRHVIAQVNPNMPRTYGRTHLHVSDVDAVVEVNEPLPELHSEEPDPVCTRIGAHVASLVRDGATLQLGIGAVPDAVLKCLAGHRNLGLHTEMCSDGVIPLVQSGVMNGAVNTLHPGVLMVGFVLGTRRLFDFIDENPLFEFHPIKYVNDPFVVARIDRMTAINSAIQIDLTGQVCSDSIGRRPYSGFGGQVDFIRGAAHARQGVPVIALPSTAKRGTVSRIVPMLDPGAGVVTSRADVHYVVTEFGVAYLHGRNLAARAEALISIADPRFRDALTAEAYAARILRPRLVAVK